MRNYVKAWADKNIVWKGSNKTNKSSRERYLPEAIVNHIVEGSAQSCINWFNDESNKDSSAHFLVAKNGKVYQFVKIEEKAWAQGITKEMYCKATAEIVKSKWINPNYYCVSIEHEGIYAETKGALTEAQLQATTMLHAYIIDYVQDKFHITIQPNRKRILGHFEINPVKKIDCPGKLFPFDRIIEGVKKLSNQLPFDDIEKHWAKDAVLEALSLGIVKGDGTKDFKPEKPVTKAELTQVALNLYKLLKK